MEAQRTAVFLEGSSILRRSILVTSVISRIRTALSFLFHRRWMSYRRAWAIMDVLGPVLRLTSYPLMFSLAEGLPPPLGFQICFA